MHSRAHQFLCCTLSHRNFDHCFLVLSANNVEHHSVVSSLVGEAVMLYFEPSVCCTIFLHTYVYYVYTYHRV
jgi:hypothetical protein